MNRRLFLGLLPAIPVMAAAIAKGTPFAISDSEKKFEAILKKASINNWKALAIGTLIANVAKEFEGAPYVGGTLEGEPERCNVNLLGLDCVTLFETSLNIARVIKAGGKTFTSLVDAVTYTRYRSGVLADYTSRLHYTADWIHDNEAKGIVKNMSKDFGGVKFPINVHFMSSNPKYYSALKSNPARVGTVAQLEESINARDIYYIPTNKIAAAEKFFKSGDIVAIATNKKGLDYAHTGLIVEDANGTPRFYHASSTQKKVVHDTILSVYVPTASHYLGVSIVRPLEPGQS